MSDTLRSVSHALRVLTLLQTVDDAGVSEVATEVGVGASTSYRLLATLVEAGYVVRDAATRRYRLGPAMTAPADREALQHCIEIATPHLAALRDAVGETVHLARLKGDATDFVVVFESPAAMRVTSRIGTAQPAHVTSAGKALLARLPDSELLARYPVDGLPGLTELSHTHRDEVMEDLAAIRERGYAKNTGESEPGITAVAMALTRPGGASIASVAVSGPESRMQLGTGTVPSERERDLVAALRECVTRIEAGLRF